MFKFIKKHYSFIIAFCAFINNAHGQVNEKSLDSFAIKIFVEKANTLLYEQTDSALIFAKKAVNASLLLNQNNISNQAYNCLGMCYYMKGEYPSSMVSFKQSYGFAKASNNIVKMATAINNQANVMVEVGNLDSALLFYKEALRLRIKTNIGMEIVQGYYNLGYIQKELGNFDASIENIVKSIEISDTLKNDRISGMCFTMMGLLQVKKEEYEKGTIWYKKALAIFINSKDESNKAIALHSIATNFSELKQYDSSIVYFENALKIHTKLNDKRQMAIGYADYGELLTRINKAEKAEGYFEKSILLHKEIDNRRTLGSTYTSAALCKLLLKKNNECKQYLDSAFSIVSTINNKVDLKNYFDVLSQYYKNVNDPAKSLDAYQKFVLYKDSILDEKKMKNIAEIEAKYNKNEQEKIISTQNSRLLSKQKWLYVIASIFTIIGFLGYLFYKRKDAKKEKDTMREQEKQLAIINENLTKATETERQRISRDLHDNMGAYTSALIANVQQLKNKTGDTDDVQKMQGNAEQILSSLRETIWVLNNKEISVQEFSDGFKNYCFKILKNFEQLNFSAIEKIENNKMLSAATAIHLNKIMQEAVQNIIKHANATAINYTVESNTKFEITIADNGIGFDETKVIKGNGLENMEWRAREAGLKITKTAASNNGGVQFIINTP